MYDEKQIVRSVLQGDLRAFEVLVRHNEKLVYFVLARLLSEKEDIQDVSQEVFIKVFRSLSRFDFQSKLSTWIARIAYMTAVNHFKKLQKEHSSHSGDELERIHFSTEDPEKLLTRKDALAYLERLIGELPEQYRVAITLYHLKEFSYAEIGEITGLPEGTVKTNLFRARKLLREKMGTHLNDMV